MDSFPGAGPVMRPRLIAALGTRRDRYLNAEEIQRCSGIAPRIERSGRQSWVHWRWACSKFLRQTFHAWASYSLAFSTWAREYYQLSAITTKAVTQPSGRWPSSGFGFCFAAGKIAPLTMKPNTCKHWPHANQNSRAIFHRT
jgi:hypothetical protein